MPGGPPGSWPSSGKDEWRTGDLGTELREVPRSGRSGTGDLLLEVGLHLWRSLRTVGFITAISDVVLAAYIPLLEVRREWRGKGVGSELVRRILAALAGFYMVDVVCDPDLIPFYERFGLVPLAGLGRRNRSALT